MDANGRQWTGCGGHETAPGAGSERRFRPNRLAKRRGRNSNPRRPQRPETVFETAALRARPRLRATAGPFTNERGSLSPLLGQQQVPLSRTFPLPTRDRRSARTCQTAPAASRCVADTVDVSVLCPRVCQIGNRKGPFEGLLQSPLADSNRRPPPYHGGLEAVLAGTPGHKWTRSSCKSGLCAVSLVSALARACSI
jgi:hypothetical protein